MRITIDIIVALGEKYYSIDYAKDYGEPGYRIENKSGILFSNWNRFPDHVVSALEKQYELEWSDEWLIDYEDDGTAYRTQPDSYSWCPSFVILDDGSILTKGSVNDYPEEYVAYLKNNSKKADMLDFNFEAIGFQKVSDEEFENGFYGITEDPAEILLKAHENFPDSIFVFQVTGQEQFRTLFVLYHRPIDYSNE